MPLMQTVITAINAATATTTSDPIDIAGAEKVSFLFTRANHSAGSTAFTVLCSVDGITFVATNMLIDNVTNTNGQTLTRVASCTLSSDTSKMYSLDLGNFCYRAIKVVATETTDGTHTAKVLIERS